MINNKVIKYFGTKILEKTNSSWDNPQEEYLVKILIL